MFHVGQTSNLVLDNNCKIHNFQVCLWCLEFITRYDLKSMKLWFWMDWMKRGARDQNKWKIQKYEILTKHPSVLFNYLVIQFDKKMLFVLTIGKWSLNQNLKRLAIQDFHGIQNWYHWLHLHHQNFRPHRLNHLVLLLFLKFKKS